MTQIKSGSPETCASKHSFVSAKEARQWLKNRPPRGNLKPYHCPICGQFHLTHKVSKHPRGARRMAAKCRSCGADIFWRRHLTTGKMAPLNMGPDPTGNLQLVGSEEYDQVKKYERDAFVAAGGLLFKSHYATCPEAKTWKTGRTQ